MTPVELSRTVLRAVRRAVDDGELSVTVPGRAVVTPPGPGGCGDYATNVALQLARPAGRPSEQVAEILRPYLLDTPGVTDVVVTGPGFLNISLGDTASIALVEEILRRGNRYGHSRGPSPDFLRLTCPHEVRAVVVMDAVARILRSQGAAVHTWSEAEPASEWTDILGVRVDAHPPRTPLAPPLHVPVRPVPAPVDPLRLGRDAGRWALLHPAAHDRPRITDEHLAQRESNPLFRIRYAHARTRALSRNAADLGFEAYPGDVRLAFEARPGHPGEAHPEDARLGDAHPAPDAHPTPLLTTLADHPRVLAAAAAHRTPDRLARHLVAVADATLPFLCTVLPRGDEKPSAAHRARLALAEAAGTVLAGGLTLLGIDAPEHL
ncbi:ArgS-related anticodon-binding protein NrtL [Streptomyces sp. S.PB5]|uniref:ArgS-related anticodon-binding protein NrtL n=1 Tax=Streptomyces sp. S.PB5 TaxID=3020844 RepID=UPI0025B0B5AD|nr:DALR anticodon-binding domain-containing protein [Streptomyces sp. S.PB5]MDN3024856.1 DALR anticodon-binding domain-containing protein [Streptomyces sp. S.PB5]